MLATTREILAQVTCSSVLTDVRSQRYLILVRILAVAYVPLLHRKHAFGIATEHYMYFREGALRFEIRSR
jgi:hypothetical protein